MKKLLSYILSAAMLLSFAACGSTEADEAPDNGMAVGAIKERYPDAVHISLFDDMTEVPEGVVLSRDIVYYEEGHDFTYGEGTEKDAHSAEEAAEHLVVTVTEPGDYLLTGSLSAGQIAVDLGEGAKDDPNAVVTLILGGVDITCTVAPAVIFYNVYECGDAENPTKDVDTSASGAQVIIADDTVNVVNGSYVARIYKSVELSEDGSEVIDSKKLHKYDGAFYSKMSMNIQGGEAGTGSLSIHAENEGLDSEMHLTINGGCIEIVSGNDGINTNEDGVSVTTVNGGKLRIRVNGSSGEGDGIDSNGWLVINGGSVDVQGCGFSGDAGIDSDMGIYLNGGRVLAAGNMLDRIAGGSATYAVFTFTSQKIGGKMPVLKNAEGQVVSEWMPEHDFTYVVMSYPELAAGDYTLWVDGQQMQHGADGTDGRLNPMHDMGGMQPPEGAQMPEKMERPEGFEPPEGMQMPEGFEPPEGMQMPEGFEPPEGMEMPHGFGGADGNRQSPNGMQRPDEGGLQHSREYSNVFTIAEGGNYFTIV